MTKNQAFKKGAALMRALENELVERVAATKGKEYAESWRGSEQCNAVIEARIKIAAEEIERG